MNSLENLQALYDCEFLESKGRFTRVTTSPEESAWHCECGCLDVDPYEDFCENCDE